MVLGSILRFRRTMRGSELSNAELVEAQDAIEQRIVAAAAARNVSRMGAVEARRRAAARRVRRSWREAAVSE